MKTDITSHRDLIERFGRPTAFSKSIGLSYNITRKWYERNKIPAHYWKRVVKASNDIGLAVSYELLAELIAK